MAQEEMKATTPNAQRSTPNVQFGRRPLPLGVGRWTLSVGRFPQLLWRVLDILIAAIFIYAGILKVLDPVQFARDIDNYKMLPWPAAVALALYLPWLEILCGLALIVRRLYRGAVLLLTGLTIVFIVASCGCFGHVSQGWSFGWHMALDFGLLAGLVILPLAQKRKIPARESRE
jgi:uncharacterized membrane protein YphA (DoxX/SURF4 family)